jgi:hypothetical protein
MIRNNIKYKQVVRLQLFGDDNVNTNARFQYSTVNTSIINAVRMRFDRGGNLGDVILSKNARVVVESASIPAVTNATNRTAVVRLLTSTEDKTFDSKKGINGNPILFCLGTGVSAGTLANLSNGYDMCYNLSIPSNFLSKGFIEMELEFPSQTSTSLVLTNTTLSILYISLIIIDIDPELTLDNTLASPFDSNNSNINFPIKQY